METLLISLCGFCSTVACLYFIDIWSWLRRKFDKSVQCWFCHVGARVKYINSNSWTCPSCGQYNGFSKDGDYNREIPSQYDVKLNQNCVTFTKPKSEFRRSKSLCSQCNYNQELKIKQLAAFVPISEANYDKEVEHYKRQLEESYKLCLTCENLVSNVVSSQKYIFSGPRRLAQLTKKLVFKSYRTLYLSMILSLLMITNRLLSVVKIPMDLPDHLQTAADVFADSFTCQILSGLGVVLHTLQCCQFGTYWSFVNWLVWAVMASSPHFLYKQLAEHVSFVQIGISLSLLISTGIILARKKRWETAVRKTEKLRDERRKKENLSATWTSPSNNSSSFNESPGKKRESPVKLTSSSSPKSNSKNSDEINLLKPVARVAQVEKKKEDLDLSTLSISSKDSNPFNKTVSPWDRVTVTRSSSFSSGISSLRSSPCSWKTSHNWKCPENNFSKNIPSTPGLSTTKGDEWLKSPSSMKEPMFRHRNDPWTPLNPYDYDPSEWDMKKTHWPTHLCPYHVAYPWPNISPNVAPSWDHSITSSPGSVRSSYRQEDNTVISKQGGVLTSLLIIILAASNASLVYYVLYCKS